ncbi:MAG TPA: hypothetical protein VLF91_05410 [Candidatus Saccharimonadales bacterium]|nr:hypothetical protein [Candidatus Saccharimonadales bacterium]
MIRFLVIAAIVVAAISLTFPVTEHCFSGQKCGAIVITFAGPDGNNKACVGKVQRPLIAKLTHLNLYYRFASGC